MFFCLIGNNKYVCVNRKDVIDILIYNKFEYLFEKRKLLKYMLI